MKSFKSFDDFLNESYKKPTGQSGTIPMNEALLSFLTPDQKFKVDEDTPTKDEFAAFHFVIKLEDENADTAKQVAANQLAASPSVMSKVENNLVFLAVTKDKERKLTGQYIFKGILSVRRPEGFDTEKAKPQLTSSDGKLKLYDANDAVKMKAGATPVQNPENVQVGSSGTAGSAGTSGTYPWDWESTQLTVPDLIQDFLREKILAIDPTTKKVSGSKVNRGAKGREVKFVQLIIKEPVFAERYGDSAKKVQAKLGSADGNFGPNTAVAFGMFFEGKDTELTAVNEKEITYLAKFCTKVGITLDRLKQLWELAGQGTSGSSGTSGSAGTAGTAGTAGQTGFIYINKPEGATTPIAPANAAAPAETTNTTTSAPLAAPTGGTTTVAAKE